MAATPPYPIYNSTFTAYRASPLYHGSDDILDEQVLHTHAQRFRDIVRGDRIRGVQIGALQQDDGLSKSGRLQDCRWDLLGDEPTWRALFRAGSGDEMEKTELSALQVGQDTLRGVYVQLEFERATHSALLLRDPSVDSDVPGFTSLPLILIRMPTPLRETFIDYITSNFDSRISPFKLSSSFLTSSLEGTIRHLNLKENAQALVGLGNGLRLQLSFPSVAPALKNIDITIATEDIQGFLLRGQHSASPLTTALHEYLRTHLALDLRNPAVQLSKIVCGPLALSGDGKVKIFPFPMDDNRDDSSLSVESSTSNAAMDEFYNALCREAATPAVLVSKAATSHGKSASDIAVDGVSRLQNRLSLSPSKASQSHSDPVSLVQAMERHVSIPNEPPPPYELHDSRMEVT